MKKIIVRNKLLSREQFLVLYQRMKLTYNRYCDLLSADSFCYYAWPEDRGFSPVLGCFCEGPEYVKAEIEYYLRPNGRDVTIEVA